MRLSSPNLNRQAKYVMINIMIVLLPLAVYYFVIVANQQKHEIEMGFRTLNEIERDFSERLSARVAAFSYLPEIKRDDSNREPTKITDTAVAPLLLGDFKPEQYEKALSSGLKGVNVQCVYGKQDGKCLIHPAYFATEPTIAPDYGQANQCTRTGLLEKAPLLLLQGHDGNAKLNIFPCHLLHKQPAASAGVINDPIIFLEQDVEKVFNKIINTWRFEQIAFGTREQVLAVINNTNGSGVQSGIVKTRLMNKLAGVTQTSTSRPTPASDDSEGQSQSQPPANDTPVAQLTKKDHVTIGGKTYTAFIKPITLPFQLYQEQSFGLSASPDSDSRPHLTPVESLYLVGLIAEQDIWHTANLLSKQAQLILYTLAILSIASWPLLRFFFTERTHALRRHDTIAISIGSWLSVTIAMVFAASFVTYNKLEKAEQERLEVIAEGITQTYQSIKTESLKKLSSFAKDLANINDKTKVKQHFCEQARDNCNFESNVFYTDSDGDIERLYPLQLNSYYRTQGGNIAERGYFSSLQKLPDGQCGDYAMQRIFNYLNGKITLQVALSQCDDTGEQPGNRFAGIVSVDHKAQGMHNLARALPPNQLFLIFERATGTVVFHKNDKRSLLENIYLEIDEETMYSLVVKNKTDTFRADYRGEPFLFRYIPLESTQGEKRVRRGTHRWSALVGTRVESLWQPVLYTWANAIGFLLLLTLLASLLLSAIYFLYRKFQDIFWPRPLQVNYVWLSGGFLLILTLAITLIFISHEASDRQHFIAFTTALSTFGLFILIQFVRNSVTARDCVAPDHDPAEPYTPQQHRNVLKANHRNRLNVLFFWPATLCLLLLTTAVPIGFSIYQDAQRFQLDLANAKKCAYVRHNNGLTPSWHHLWQNYCEPKRDNIANADVDGTETTTLAERLWLNATKMAGSVSQNTEEYTQPTRDWPADTESMSTTMDGTSPSSPPQASDKSGTLSSPGVLVTLPVVFAFMVLFTIGVRKFVGFSWLWLGEHARHSVRPRCNFNRILWLYTDEAHAVSLFKDTGDVIDLHDIQGTCPQFDSTKHYLVLGFDDAIIDRKQRCHALTIIEKLIHTRCAFAIHSQMANLSDLLLTPDTPDTNNSSDSTPQRRRWIRVLFLLRIARSEYSSLSALFAENNDDRPAIPDAAERELKALMPFFSLQQQKEALTLVDPNDNAPRRKLVDYAAFHGEFIYWWLWEECTRAEKIALYAMAKKQIPNPQNYQVIAQLLARNLCCLDPYPRIHSISWREFILHAERADIIKRWTEESSSGFWQAFRTPAIILILLLFVLLAVSSTDMTQRVMTLIGAGLGVLVNVFALFGRGNVSLGNLNE